jgi:glycosyltransferase involved in cell wall biosynthesis
MINIIAPINPLGYGVTGLNIVKSLCDIDKSIGLFIQGEAHLTSEEDANIVRSCVQNAMKPNFDYPCLRIWHQHDMSMFVGNGPKIGFPIFELEVFDEMEKHHLSHLDKIFVCSHWAKNVVLNNIDIPENRVQVVTLGVDRNIFTSSASVEKEGQRENGPTIFFNCGKWEVRKGHDVLPDIFVQALSQDDNMELWMMTSNPFLSEQQDQEWKTLYTSKLGDKVKFINRVASHNEVYNIMSKVDCGIFPARTEGWNLEALELMSCGKASIISNTAGHTEFCNDENSYLVDLEEKEIAYDGTWFHGNKGNWPAISKQNVEAFVEHILSVHNLAQSQSLLTNSAGVETAKRFSWRQSALQIAEYSYDKKIR